MDRLDTASYAGEFTYEFDYTLTGMRDLITEQRSGSTTWTSAYDYDHQDRVTSVATPNGTVSYTYDPNGNRASMTTPSGTTSYQYNGNDQLTQVTAPMGQTNLTYTNVGLPDTLTYPNGVVKDYSYDERDRLTSLTYQDGMTTLAAYNYTLDTVGHRTRVDELGGDYTTWGYDDQYRLTDETIHDGGSTLSSSYTYDDVGNRTSQTVNGQATTYSYNALDQMTQSVTGGVTTTYAYDGRGNLATTMTGSDVTTYTYDALDRLITAQVPGSSAAAYTYDPSGQRVRQTVGSDTTNYLWDELSAYGDVVRETNGTGTELASYTLAGSQLLGQTRSGVTSYYLSDGQGSTRALLNGTGDLTDTYDYTAFGEIYNQTGSTLNSYLYTGQQFDSLTGLYSLRARYYDPGLGRFVSRDTYPINYRNPIELNRYGYTANNPINRYDPTGNMSLTEFFTSTLAGHIFGGALIGGMISFISSGIFYLMADNGFCGERMKEWAEQTDPWSYLFEATFMGAVTGAVIGGLPSIGRYAGQFFGFLGYGVSVYDMVTNGPNLCNGLTAILSIGAIAGGGTIPTPILVAEDVPIVEAGVIGLNGAFTSNPAIGYQSLYGVAVGAIPADATVASIIGGIAVLFSSGGGDDNDGNEDSSENDDDAGETPPTDPYEEELMRGYNEQQQSEIRGYMSRWDKGSYETVAESIVDHCQRKGWGKSYLNYLRTAFEFVRVDLANARRSPATGVRPDGSVRYRLDSTGEYVVLRDGRIVTYGIGD